MVSRRLLVATQILGLLGTVAAGTAWEKASDEDGILVYTRSASGAEVKEVKAIGHIAAPPARVWRVIGDYANYKDFMPYTLECRVVRQEKNASYVYSLLKFFWPIGDRCYTLRIEHDTTRAAKGIYRSSWDLAKKHVVKPPADTIVPPINKGYWYFEPAGAGKTRATYYLLTHPGGRIPTSLANRANRTAVPDIIRAVRKRVKDRRYDR